MMHLSEDPVTQMMGVGYLGEVRQGPDGNVYQYVQGVDGLGNPLGFWRRLKRFARGALRRALPIAQRFAPFIPGGAAALTVATPLLKQAGVAGYDGLGELYQAPDGTLYQQVQGLAEDRELQGLGEDKVTQMMGLGSLGEVRQGPDGNLYQYMQGVDELGNLAGFWGKVRKLASRVIKYHPAALALKAASPLLRKALPIAQRVASAIPGGTEALTAATPILRQAGVNGYDGLGALYQAPDGTLYQQVQGLADDDELHGLEEDEELRGIDEDDELRGLSENEELRGLDDDEELRGLDADEELHGFAEDEELRGVAEEQDMQGIQGYVRQDGVNGLEAFVPQELPQTRWHVTPAQAPEVWKTLW
jgi:hypothetical protein